VVIARDIKKQEALTNPQSKKIVLGLPYPYSKIGQKQTNRPVWLAGYTLLRLGLPSLYVLSFRIGPF